MAMAHSLTSCTTRCMPALAEATYWLLSVVRWRTSLALWAAMLQLSEIPVATCTICSLSWCRASACSAVWRLLWLIASTRLTEV